MDQQDEDKVQRRLKAFTVSNGSVLAAGLLTHQLDKTEKWKLWFLASALRMGGLTALVSWSASKKEPIHKEKRTKTPRNDLFVKLKLILNMLVAAAGEVFSKILIVKMGLLAIKTTNTTTTNSIINKARNRHGRNSASSIIWWLSSFVLKSFAYEATFDFFHYWTHRLCHEYPSLYKYHKSHHAFLHPTPLTTFKQHPVDILFTNVFPNVASIMILSSTFGFKFTGLEYSILSSFKNFVEIAGHAGIETNATSFPQFKWLPSFLGIELKTDDHDLHHSSPSTPGNYSKRFTLWDKVFQTYIDQSKLKKLK